LSDLILQRLRFRSETGEKYERVVAEIAEIIAPRFEFYGSSL
jgi:hypothetical protein